MAERPLSHLSVSQLREAASEHYKEVAPIAKQLSERGKVMLELGIEFSRRMAKRLSPEAAWIEDVVCVGKLDGHMSVDALEKNANDMIVKLAERGVTVTHIISCPMTAELVFFAHQQTKP